MTLEEYNKIIETIWGLGNPYEGNFHAQFSHGFEVCRQALQEKIEKLRDEK